MGATAPLKVLHVCNTLASDWSGVSDRGGVLGGAPGAGRGMLTSVARLSQQAGHHC
jgi:hypothetical protein